MKYRKKPVEVDAMQYTGKNYLDIKDFFPYIILYVGKRCSIGAVAEESDFEKLPVNILSMETLGGCMRISPQDWIIKGVAGEFYPVKPDIFEKTYEKVEEI